MKGTIRPFNGAAINMNIDYASVFNLQGDLTRARGSDLPRLRNKLFEFIRDGHRFGIITTSHYSMAIYVNADLGLFVNVHKHSP